MAFPLYKKKCPICGHPAMEHQEGRKGDLKASRFTSDLMKLVRYCNHPIPSEEDPDLVNLCDCVILDDDYERVGNYALIRLDANAAKPSMKKAT